MVDDSITVAGYRSDLATIASDSVLGEFDRAAGRRAERHTSGASGVSATAPSCAPMASGCASITAGCSMPARTSSSPPTTGTTTSSSAIAPAAAISTIAASSISAMASQRSRASYAAPGLEPNESWRYSRTDGDLIFHFIAREDVQDFKLVESLFDVLGFSNAVRLQGRRGRSDNVHGRTADAVAGAALAHLPPAQAAGRGSTGRYQDQERRAGQESIALGTTSDSYELRFPKELKATSEVLAVGRDSAGQQVQIAYAIAGASLEPVTVTRGLPL